MDPLAKKLAGNAVKLPRPCHPGHPGHFGEEIVHRVSRDTAGLTQRFDATKPYQLYSRQLLMQHRNLPDEWAAHHRSPPDTVVFFSKKAYIGIDDGRRRISLSVIDKDLKEIRLDDIVLFLQMPELSLDL